MNDKVANKNQGKEFLKLETPETDE